MKKIASFLSLAVLLTGCQTNTFTHKHFQERVARIHTVRLVPQVHTAILNTYFGFDTFPAPFPQEQQIRSELTASAIDQLQRLGFVIMASSPPDLTNQTWNGRMIQQACSEVPSQAARPDARALADDLNVDGLIFLDAAAYSSTLHRQKITTPQNIIAYLSLPAILIGAGPLPDVPCQQAAAQIALVDSKTGEVLWATADCFYDDFEKHTPSQTIEDLFSRYPKQKP